MIVHFMPVRRRSAEVWFCPRPSVALTLGPSQIGSGAARFGEGPPWTLAAVQAKDERGLS